MLHLAVESDDERVSPTQTASPSAEAATRTSEPLAPANPGNTTAESRSLGPSQLRDPERYQIIGEHGRGGLGRVSRAHDRELGRDVAIKELISRGHVSEVRFLREALITARLEHPGIVPIHEAGRWPDGTPFYAMKLVAGRSLRDLIAERTTVEARIGLLHHVIAVADAIAYAHGRNIIHRDLKPANIIVGDFGETVVIDWGLAKDLTSDDDVSVGGGPFRTNRDEGLTSTGSVLGTPAYMAPEQGRGERVDQRADVFAIGAMLWELCTVHKPLSIVPHHRHRVLRRAGIDKDLVAIIDKALDPAPERRYLDAGALAADLKAFKSGARIAARSYSPLAMLGHWTRRHRGLAVSIVTAAAVATGGTAFYVRNIATERDRAETSNNNLVLEHAQLLLQSDPTAAFELLSTYHGGNAQRLAMLRAEARGLGLSHLRTRPHTQAIYFAHALPDGALVTLGGDGTVAKTTIAGSTRVIARGVAPQHTFAYSHTRHLLAYACDAAALCLLDVQAETMRPAPAGGTSFAPVALALSSGGDLLAAISPRGETAVWQLPEAGPPTLRYQASVDGAKDLSFVDDQTVAVRAPEQVRILHLDRALQPASQPDVLSVPGAVGIGSSPGTHLVAVTTTTGELAVIDSTQDQIVERAGICKGRINYILMLPDRSAVAYACQDGDAGIWDLRQRTRSVLAYLEGGAAVLAASADGRYLLVGGNNGRLLAHDFTTQMVSSYLGHATRLTELLSPSPDFPYIVSGDTSGTMRTWSPPDAAVRVAIKTAAGMSRAILLPNKGPLIAIGEGTTVPWYDRSGVSGDLQGHDPAHSLIALSTTQARFAMYGRDDEVELWSFEARASNRRLHMKHGAVAAVVLAPDGARLVAGSRDGTVTEWSSADDSYHDLGTIHELIMFMLDVPHTDTVVIGGASGTLSLANKAGISHLGNEADPVTVAVRSQDARWLAVGTTQGAVRLYDVSTRQASTIFSTRSWIEMLSFSPDSAELAIATESRVVFTAVTRSSIDHARRLPEADDPRSHEVGHPVRYVSFSPDNRWFAMTCDHGDIWFYRRKDDHWFYRSVGTTKISFGKFSDDSADFAASDASGKALIVDMRASAFN